MCGGLCASLECEWLLCGVSFLFQCVRLSALICALCGVAVQLPFLIAALYHSGVWEEALQVLATPAVFPERVMAIFQKVARPAVWLCVCECVRVLCCVD